MTEAFPNVSDEALAGEIGKFHRALIALAGHNHFAFVVAIWSNDGATSSSNAPPAFTIKVLKSVIEDMVAGTPRQSQRRCPQASRNPARSSHRLRRHGAGRALQRGSRLRRRISL